MPFPPFSSYSSPLSPINKQGKALSHRWLRTAREHGLAAPHPQNFFPVMSGKSALKKRIPGAFKNRWGKAVEN
jgi:hypothetical protein